MFQWTWKWKYLFEILFAILLNKYPEGQLLDHMVVLVLIFEDPKYFFPLWINLYFKFFFFFCPFKIVFCYYHYWCRNCSIQLQSCLTLCNPRDCSMPGLLVHHQLLEFTETHVHWVGDDFQPSHLLSPSPLAFNLSQHQGFFKSQYFT